MVPTFATRNLTEYSQEDSLHAATSKIAKFEKETPFSIALKACKISDEVSREIKEAYTAEKICNICDTFIPHLFEKIPRKDFNTILNIVLGSATISDSANLQTLSQFVAESATRLR